MERRIVIEGIPLTTKASVGSISTLAFDASHEARRRRMVVFFIQLTRKPHRTSEPRGLLPSGGISQPTHMSLYTPARRRRAVRGQGVLPLARGPSPSGGISQSTHMSPYAPARRRRAVQGQGVLPLARAARPVAERRYFAVNSHVSLCPCAPAARSPNEGLSPQFCRER